MTIPFRIGNSAVVTLFGREGRIIKTDELGYVFEGLQTPGQTERISFDDFERLQGGPDLKIETKKSASSSRFNEKKHVHRPYLPLRLCPKAIDRVFERAEKCGVTIIKAGNMLGYKTDKIENLIKRGQLAEIPEYARRTRAKFRTVERDGVVALQRSDGS